jgi:hypothetical protein
VGLFFPRFQVMPAQMQMRIDSNLVPGASKAFGKERRLWLKHAETPFSLKWFS